MAHVISVYELTFSAWRLASINIACLHSFEWKFTDFGCGRKVREGHWEWGEAEIVCESSPQVVGIKRREPSRTARPSAFVQSLLTLQQSTPWATGAGSGKLLKKAAKAALINPGPWWLHYQGTHTHQGLKAIVERRTLKCCVKQGQETAEDCKGRHMCAWHFDPFQWLLVNAENAVILKWKCDVGRPRYFIRENNFFSLGKLQ